MADPAARPDETAILAELRRTSTDSPPAVRHLAKLGPAWDHVAREVERRRGEGRPPPVAVDTAHRPGDLAKQMVDALLEVTDHSRLVVTKYPNPDGTPGTVTYSYASKHDRYLDNITRQAAQDLYLLLVAAAGDVDIPAAKVRVNVRCGIDNGKTRCRRRVGLVVETARGVVWSPTRPPADFEPGPGLGRLPFLLVPSLPAGNCTTLTGHCPKHRGLDLAVAELLRPYRLAQARRGTLDHTFRRVIPTRWGPMTDDPAYWTPADGREALDAVFAMAEKRWPPPGMAGIHRSMVEARARTIAAYLLLAADGARLQENGATLTADNLSRPPGSMP